MGSTVTLSFRVSPEKAEALEKLSRSTERPKAWLLERALEGYLRDQAWQITAVEEGIAAAEAGETVAHEEVRDWLSSWGREDERDPPA